jgi:hypothetical protein
LPGEMSIEATSPEDGWCGFKARIPISSRFFRTLSTGGYKREIKARWVYAPGFLCKNAKQELGEKERSQAGAWERDDETLNRIDGDLIKPEEILARLVKM